MDIKKPFLTKFAKPAEDGIDTRCNDSQRLSETFKTKVNGETTDDS